jgi:hypothetical protein
MTTLDDGKQHGGGVLMATGTGGYIQSWKSRNGAALLSEALQIMAMPEKPRSVTGMLVLRHSIMAMVTLTRYLQQSRRPSFVAPLCPRLARN